MLLRLPRDLLTRPQPVALSFGNSLSLSSRAVSPLLLLLIRPRKRKRWNLEPRRVPPVVQLLSLETYSQDHAYPALPCHALPCPTLPCPALHSNILEPRRVPLVVYLTHPERQGLQAVGRVHILHEAGFAAARVALLGGLLWVGGGGWGGGGREGSGSDDVCVYGIHIG